MNAIVDNESKPGSWEEEFRHAPWLLRRMGVTECGCRWESVKVNFGVVTIEGITLEMVDESSPRG